MWPQWMHSNREKMLAQVEGFKSEALKGGMNLHMGCGPQILDGFINIDKYYKDDRVTQLDMYQTSYHSGSVDRIYSSHSLEHLPYRKARKALIHWANLLKPNGVLYLAVPDLEEICKKIIDPDMSEDLKWQWFVYTLFGYQTDSSISTRDLSFDLPEDPGQFHTCGFTEKSLKIFIEDTGLKIQEQYKYEGWGTPSIWTVATKNV